MAWTNLSFETAGTLPGEADGWTLDCTSAATRIAAYAEGYQTTPVAAELWEPWESFSGGWRAVWSGVWPTEPGNETDHNEFVDAEDLEAARYIVGYVGWHPLFAWWESFEGGWKGNHDDLLELVGPQPAQYYSSAPPPYGAPYPFVETFGNTPYGMGMFPGPPDRIIGMTWASPFPYCFSYFYQPSDLVAATYAGKAWEGFESGWKDNEHDQQSFNVPGDLDPAIYPFGWAMTPYDYEGFEGLWAENPCTAHIGPPDTIRTVNACGLLVGDRIKFRTLDGQLPRPLISEQLYVVHNLLSITEFEVEDEDGNVLTWTDIGYGTSVVYPDPAGWWHTDLGPV